MEWLIIIGMDKLCALVKKSFRKKNKMAIYCIWAGTKTMTKTNAEGMAWGVGKRAHESAEGGILAMWESGR